MPKPVAVSEPTLTTLRRLRAEGVTKATWHDSGELASVEFAPLRAPEPEKEEKPAMRKEDEWITPAEALRRLDRKPFVPSGRPEAV